MLIYMNVDKNTTLYYIQHAIYPLVQYTICLLLYVHYTMLFVHTLRTIPFTIRVHYIYTLYIIFNILG